MSVKFSCQLFPNFTPAMKTDFALPSGMMYTTVSSVPAVSELEKVSHAAPEVAEVRHDVPDVPEVRHDFPDALEVRHDVPEVRHALDELPRALDELPCDPEVLAHSQ